MVIDLEKALPQLLPLAIQWAEAQGHASAFRGISLKPIGLDFARSVGVLRPEQIRVDVVNEMPMPSDPQLLRAAHQVGLFGPGTHGLTLGYAVLIVRGHEMNPRLLRHELRHVQQYENCGSIASFLAKHLRDLVAYGYENSPFEVDARAHEHDGA